MFTKNILTSGEISISINPGFVWKRTESSRIIATGTQNHIPRKLIFFILLKHILPHIFFHTVHFHKAFLLDADQIEPMEST